MRQGIGPSPRSHWKCEVRCRGAAPGSTRADASTFSHATGRSAVDVNVDSKVYQRWYLAGSSLWSDIHAHPMILGTCGMRSATASFLCATPFPPLRPPNSTRHGCFDPSHPLSRARSSSQIFQRQLLRPPSAHPLTAPHLASPPAYSYPPASLSLSLLLPSIVSVEGVEYLPLVGFRL